MLPASYEKIEELFPRCPRWLQRCSIWVRKQCTSSSSHILTVERSRFQGRLSVQASLHGRNIREEALVIEGRSLMEGSLSGVAKMAPSRESLESASVFDR